jgi:hypothetical protein
MGIEEHTGCHGRAEMWDGIKREEAKYLQASMWWVLQQNGINKPMQTLQFDVGEWSEALNVAFQEWLDLTEQDEKNQAERREAKGLGPKENGQAKKTPRKSGSKPRSVTSGANTSGDLSDSAD